MIKSYFPSQVMSAFGQKILHILNRNKRRITNTIVVTSLTTYLITNRVATTARVSGASMVPSFNARGGPSYVLLDLLTPVTKIQPSDVVLCHDPEEYGQYILKRVSALAGQLVDVEEDFTGEYARKYVYEGKISVPTGYCWVEGDNKSVSVDSREFGPVPLGLIKGRVICTLWNG